jgi:hypothetical protein
MRHPGKLARARKLFCARDFDRNELLEIESELARTDAGTE